MSDLDKWKDFFDLYGIKYTVKKIEEPQSDPLWADCYIVETDEGIGYNGFVFCLTFNADGSFRNYGVWE
jgi:hypothetical protein